ncbi:hypothetical protein Pm5460_19 [Proteus phage vB_PmiP_Pm5460]|uniref:Uncharacterized protein n=1 Tax=Proteus phage vB_PmiP_Pm5460 TaxID=1636249 RepID=A0A0G2SS01_9CAUD|nr:hypothetical protein AVT60_gp19 [Proteus phage vB_PmiP_Pm5460]AKA61828.1 hypothetical protein Pm5460_19 [Proteus phage vB_PmiP_Pm5460]
MKVTVINTVTGSLREYENAEMMVAPNGVIFVKRGKQTLFASGSTDIIVEAQ